MTVKIGYFTLGPIPVTAELTDIANLKSAGAIVMVRNAAAYALSTNQPAVDADNLGLEDFDYVYAHAGTAYPTDYDDTDDFPVADPAAPPVGPGLPATAKVLYSGKLYVSPAPSGSRTTGYVPTIAAGIVTAQVGG